MEQLNVKPSKKVKESIVTLEEDNVNKNIIFQNLVEVKEGMTFSSQHGKKIWEGKKNLIVKSKLYRSAVNKLLYLIEDDTCYGLIKIKYPEKINIKDFGSMENSHTITEEERNKWWPNKEILFAYEFDKINMFDIPKKIKIEGDLDIFVKDFEFLNVQEEFIKDIGTYDPEKVENKQLANDWKIVMSWYSTKKSGGNLKHSIENITNLAGIIYKEIIKRIDDKKMEYKFDIDKMTAIGKELYDIISGKIGLTKKLTEVNIFSPMKSSKIFYQIDESISYMFKNNTKYALEKKYKGFRVLLTKEKDKITLYSDSQNDISKSFPTIIAEATQLSQKNLIIDGEIICESYGSGEIAKYIKENEKINESKIEFSVFDCINFGNDISNSTWSARKQILHSLNFTKHIKEVNSIIVNTPEETKKAIKLLRNLQGSEGAMIKNYNGKYKKDGESDDWIKFMNEDTSINSMTTTKDSKDVSGEARGEEVIGPDKQGKEDPEAGIWGEKKVIENSVVKKGDQWCVVHGHTETGGPHDKPIGSIIKCFPKKEDAEAMHKAIIISEIKRKKMQDTMEEK